MTSSAGRRSASGRAAFSRSRRKTFSTSMIASSTSAPIAIARPPSVIVLMVTPSAPHRQHRDDEREREREQRDRGRPDVHEEQEQDER